MPDKQLVFEDFRDRVGSVFTPCEEGVPPIPLTLDSAELLPTSFARPGIRPPFSLMFTGAGDLILPQRIYQLTHPEMGELAIFLVPLGKGENGARYQATFN